MNKTRKQRHGYYIRQDRKQKMKDPTMNYVKEPETTILEMQTMNPGVLVERNCFDNPDISFVYVIDEFVISDE